MKQLLQMSATQSLSRGLGISIVPGKENGFGWLCVLNELLHTGITRKTWSGVLE